MLRAGLLVICSSVLVVSLLHSAEGRDRRSDYAEEQFKTDDADIKRFPWPTKAFKCPTMFGAYPDPADCGYFYACVYKIATRTGCPHLTRFDKNKRLCMPMLIAVCDDSAKTTASPKTTLSKDFKFKCPKFIGTFPHPEDCSKYFSCTMFMASLKTCPQSQLFDEDANKCLPEEDVDCGSRKNPNEPTTPYQTENPTPSEDDEETTTEGSSSKPTTVDEEPSTAEATTTERPPQTAPDTDCDKDDVDCIIDDLGETPDWFDCPKDVGGYPHPSSQKLFIFCLNWKPSVKKCGQDLVFSKILMTCVSP